MLPEYGFDDRTVSLYAKGMTTRDIQVNFEDVYGVEVSATFISQATNAVMDEVTAWQNRPLDAIYPIVYLDALVVRSRASGAVQNKSVYLALGINMDGEKELMGLWMAQTEGAKFWLSVMKVLYLALHQISKKWTMPIRDWKQAMGQFMILFGDRVSL